MLATVKKKVLGTLAAGPFGSLMLTYYSAIVLQ